MTFIRFLLTSGFAAAVNILSRMAFSVLVPYEVAIVVAYLLGMTVAFVLARRFVFDKSGHSPTTEYARFAMVNAVALVQVWAVSVALARWVFPAIGFDHQPELVAHVIGVLSPAVTSYYGHKLFSFRAVDGRK